MTSLERQRHLLEVKAQRRQFVKALASAGEHQMPLSLFGGHDPGPLFRHGPSIKQGTKVKRGFHYRRWLKLATPPWADRPAIAALYREAKRLTEETGIRYSVDHVIPLRNPMVCGLNVENNMRVMTEAANMRKGNSFVEDQMDLWPTSTDVIVAELATHLLRVLVPTRSSASAETAGTKSSTSTKREPTVWLVAARGRTSGARTALAQPTANKTPA